MRDPSSKFPSLAAARLPVGCPELRSSPRRASTNARPAAAAQHVQSPRRGGACGFVSCNRHWTEENVEKLPRKTLPEENLTAVRRLAFPKRHRKVLDGLLRQY